MNINIPPEGGWKQHTVYLVKVMCNKNNPEHEALLHVGFMQGLSFGGYCEVWCNAYDNAIETSKLYSIKFVQELCKLN